MASVLKKEQERACFALAGQLERMAKMLRNPYKAPEQVMEELGACQGSMYDVRVRHSAIIEVERQEKPHA